MKLPSLDALRQSSKVSRPHLPEPDFSIHKPVTKPSVVFKSFDRFSRPDTRKSLLEKILGKGKGENTLDPEEVKKAKLEKEENEEVEVEIDSNDVTTVSDDLQTTLHVSTVFPASSSVILEVATIRSPYSFDFEDGKSTRLVFRFIHNFF